MDLYNYNSNSTKDGGENADIQAQFLYTIEITLGLIQIRLLKIKVLNVISRAPSKKITKNIYSIRHDMGNINGTLENIYVTQNKATIEKQKKKKKRQAIQKTNSKMA